MEAEWRNTNEVIADLQGPLDEVCRRGAEMIARDAIALVPVDTGTLKKEIDVEVSKFKGGGWNAIAQGSDNYTKFYASFVEFGTPHRTPNYPEQRYMRPAIKRNRQRIYAMWQESLDE